MNPRTFSLVVLVAVGLAVIVVLILRRGEEPEPGPDRAAPDVGFEVLDAGCGYENVVTAQATIPPENDEFCLVRVTVTNRGEGEATPSAACQFLVSTTGERFAPRPDVLAVDAASRAAFQAAMAPGQVVEDAGLYYDVPAGTRPATAEFHTACGDEPVTVDL